jgi:NTE family protein
VDTATGELRIFDRASGVDLVDAVAASCAVPGIWPPVEIDGASYMDGGMRTTSNADLAGGGDRVLVLVPGPEVSPMGPAITPPELVALAGSRLRIVYADEDSLAAMGSNPLDPESRGPAAQAGRRVGRRVAAAVARLWD